MKRNYSYRAKEYDLPFSAWTDISYICINIYIYKIYIYMCVCVCVCVCMCELKCKLHINLYIFTDNGRTMNMTNDGPDL
jgi:hypothetical protein